MAKKPSKLKIDYMTYPQETHRTLSLALVVIAGLTLTACGGGGSSSDASAVNTAAAAPPVGAAAVSAPASATDAVNPDVALALAIAETSPAPPASPVDAQTSPGVGIASASGIGADSGATVAAVPVTTASPMGISRSSNGATYYLDSKLGSDANNGLVATAGTGGAGPWRSLAKLATAALNPGDRVLLACGNVWNETLKLVASGTATGPITVSSFPAGCSTQPTIDGSQAIAAGAWTLHQGNIYKTTLTAAPLQVSAATGFMTQAHHPNRGYDAAQVDSLYLRNAVASDKTVMNGRSISTYVTTGTDLKLPTGAALTVGTKIRIRTNSWTLDDSVVSAVSGTRLSLTTPTSYPLDAGWGYFLLGQLWMLDSPGEWHYDETSKTLYSWMPDSRAPGTTVLVTQLATGIDLQALKYITVDNLAIRKVGTGINLKSSTNVTVRNTSIQDANDYGANAAGSVLSTFDSNTIARVGIDGIAGVINDLPYAGQMRVVNNTLTDIGVAMAGETALSLPRSSYAAIRPGTNAIITGNNITNTGYVGIWPMTNSTVNNNVLYGTCTVLDDCAAIYAHGVTASVISGNLVQRSRGAIAGKDPSKAFTQGQGIYLDEGSSGVTISGNTVIDTDNGVQVHVSAKNTIKDNKLYGNRKTQIWMQEDRNVVNPQGDLFGNVVTGNQIVPTAATAKGISLDTRFAETAHFGLFDWNRFFDRIYPLVATERNSTTTAEYTLAQWQGATSGTGATRGLDPNGSGTGQAKFASVQVSGGNIVPNGNLAIDFKGWTSWNATKPNGIKTREACQPGWCAKYVAGASAGLLTSPNFSTVAGKWYRIALDVSAGADNQAVSMVVRRGGGGSNGYESLGDRSLNFTANKGWRRFGTVFMATKTVNAADPITGDMGARIDLQNIAPGQSITVTNIEIVPVTPVEGLTRSDILVNATANPAQVNCPAQVSQPALCTIYVRLNDTQPVGWPYYLAPRSAEIIYALDKRLIDSDGDGIADVADRCPSTPAGSNVNSQGCAFGQI